MRNFTFAAIAAAALFAGSAVLAEDDSQATPAAQVQMASAGDAMQVRVCGFQVHEGMLLRRPVCRTAREFDSLMRTRQREIAEFQIHGSGSKSW